MPDIYVVACGGHGRVVLDALLASGTTVAGVIDPALAVGDRVFGVPVVGGDDFLARISPEQASLANGLGANPRVRPRGQLFGDLVARGFAFPPIKHPSVVAGRECEFGAGSQVMAGAVLQWGVRIGRNAVINTRSSLDHGCTIGAHTFISPGVVLAGDVAVDESVFIGCGAIVLPGVHIGAGAVVGAGSLVKRDVPQGWVVAGNPTKRIGAKD